MPISFFRFLLGYVKFSFTGGFADKFVNECFLRNINIKNIIYKENALYAEASIKSYRALHRIALKCGGTVKISKKCGLPFLLAPLKGRWGFFAGVLFFVLFISYMGGFVWNITVIGNNRLAEAKIVDYLAQNGFKTGCRWANVDKENLEFEILSDFDEVAWVSINKLGCLAQIEISESVPKPDIVDSGRITNVKASKDGVIVHVTALGGWPEVREGDAVAKGDLLISGVFESEVDKKNHFAHAHGEVLAQTNKEITINICREQSKKDFKNSQEYKSFYFFGLEIPLYLKKQKGDAQISLEKSYLVLNSFRLPIGIFTEKCDYYIESKETLTDEALEALATGELENRKAEELKNCEILSENIELETDESTCTVRAQYSLLEDIAEEYEIIFSDEEDAN